MEKKQDGNYARMLRAILNNSWKQLPTKHQQYGHLPPTSKITKQDQQDMQDMAGETRKNSQATLFDGPLHMDPLVLADQQELTLALCRDWM